MAPHSVIQKSRLEGAKRLDAEYYQPEYLDVDRKIFALKIKTIQDISEKVFSGPFGSTLKSDSYQSSGIPFIRIGDIVDVFLNKDNLVYISPSEHKRIYSTRLNVGDIVLSKIGTVGRLSVISKKFGEVNISENNIGIRISKLSPEFRSYFLFFLLSKYGQSQILRRASGNIQLKLNVSDIQKIKIPIVDKLSLFLDLYEQILTAKEQSDSLYAKAENFLLEELGLKDFEVKESLSWTVNLSDTKTTGRIDAEYFQPKYERLVRKLKTHDAKTLGELATMKKGFEPGSEEYQGEGKLFIRVSNITKDGLAGGSQKYIGDDLYGKLKMDYQPKVGEILLTKDATPGVAFVLKEQVDGIISGGILRLKVKEEVEPEYLALCINSIAGQLQVERDAGGSIIVHWKPDQVKALQIPILPKSTQQKIAEFVRQSHEARKKAKQLLEQAKQMVESLIEKSEIYG